MNTKPWQNKIKSPSFILNELDPDELELISAAGCCVLYSCWHPENIFDKTPYPSLYVNYDTEKACVAAVGSVEHICDYRWYPDKRCNQFQGRVEEL